MFTPVAMLYVEKDLSGVVKAVFDQWDLMKHELNHRVLYCASARVSPGDIISIIENCTPSFAFPILIKEELTVTSDGKDMQLGLSPYNRRP